MAKWFLCCASVSGFLAVAIGAFGAHGLKGKLSSDMIAVYNTGVEYQFYHSLALLLVALFLTVVSPTRWLLTSASGFLLGIVLFSGSLYWLALGGPTWLGPITPLGGVCFMVGWLALCIDALTRANFKNG